MHHQNCEGAAASISTMPPHRADGALCTRQWCIPVQDVSPQYAGCVVVNTKA